MRHANIAVFVPHLGCPHRCSFCDQRSIAGTGKLPHAEDIEKAVISAKQSSSYDPQLTEIAFFGGSFTAIDRDYMIELLSAAYGFVRSGDVKGIRVSTRPDYIDTDVLNLLKQYGVTAIELGAQSMSDEVLTLNERGHSASDVITSSNLIRSYGFELGLQMMTGLYGDTPESTLLTAKQIISLHPDTVRIYPTVVLEGTTLGELYKKGKYRPQTLDEAVELCVTLCGLFDDAGIRVIRLGLHTIDQAAYLAGPWHPAFRELCDSRKYYQIIRNTLEKKGSYHIFVKDTELSKAIGQSKDNVKKLAESGFVVTINPDSALKPYQIITKEVKGSRAANFDSNSGI